MLIFKSFAWAVLHCRKERKALDRELARAKVTANRVVVVVANGIDISILSRKLVTNPCFARVE